MTDRTQHRGRCQAPVVVNAAAVADLRITTPVIWLTNAHALCEQGLRSALQFLVTHHELDVREDQGRSDERIPILNSDPHLMLTRRHL